MSEPVGLLFADDPRARQWELALQAEGLHPLRIETRGADADRGDYQICVPPLEAARARKIVSAVLSGQRKLPPTPRLSRPMVMLAALIVGILVALLVGGLLAT